MVAHVLHHIENKRITVCWPNGLFQKDRGFHKILDPLLGRHLLICLQSLLLVTLHLDLSRSVAMIDFFHGVPLL